MTEYRNIVFDLGNVILKVDEEGCYAAIATIGLGQVLKSKDGLILMHRLGTGMISTEDFFKEVRRLSGMNVSDDTMRDAINKMLVNIPDEKKAKLFQLKEEGKHLFMLSNTIDMHWDFCLEHLFDYNGKSILDCFDSVFLSQRMHLEKPDPRIFEEVAKQTGIIARETLFIDDHAENCEAARRSVGWSVYQNKDFNDWMKIL